MNHATQPQAAVDPIAGTGERLRFVALWVVFPAAVWALVVAGVLLMR